MKVNEEALDKAAREGYAVRCKTNGPRVLARYASDDIMAMQLKDDRTIIQAYLDATSEANWQPIETAPKDWTDILLFDPDYPSDHRKVFEGYFDADLECWRAADTGLRREIFPTHWQPLPEPPK